MGQQVDKERFSEAEFARFGERLEDPLVALRELLARPGFGAGPATIGAELELFLVDARRVGRCRATRRCAPPPPTTGSCWSWAGSTWRST